MKKRLRLLQRLSNAMFSNSNVREHTENKVSAETLQAEKRALKEKLHKNLYTAVDSLQSLKMADTSELDGLGARLDLLMFPGLDETRTISSYGHSARSDIGLSHRTRFSNLDPFGQAITPLYANKRNPEVRYSGNSRPEAEALMRTSLRRLGHFPRQPIHIGNHEVPAPPRLLLRRKGSGLPPWTLRRELPKIDSQLDVEEIIGLYRHQCFFCGVYFP